METNLWTSKTPRELIEQFDVEEHSSQSIINRTSNLIAAKDADISADVATLEKNLQQMEQIRGYVRDLLAQESQCCGYQSHWSAWGATLIDTLAEVATLSVNINELAQKKYNDPGFSWGLACIVGSTVISKIRDRIWFKRVEWIQTLGELEKIANSNQIEHVRSSIKSFLAYQHLVAEKQNLPDGELFKRLSRIRKLKCNDRDRLTNDIVTRCVRVGIITPEQQSDYFAYVKQKESEEEGGGDADKMLRQLTQRTLLRPKQSMCGKVFQWRAIQTKKLVENIVTPKMSPLQQAFPDVNSDCLDLIDRSSVWNSEMNLQALEDGITHQYNEAELRISAVGTLLEKANNYNLDLGSTVEALQQIYVTMLVYFVIIYKISLEMDQSKKVVARKGSLRCRAIFHGFIDIGSIATKSIQIVENAKKRYHINAEYITIAFIIGSAIFSKIHDFLSTRAAQDEADLITIQRLNGQRAILDNVVAMIKTFSAIRDVKGSQDIHVTQYERALLNCKVPSLFRRVLKKERMESVLMGQVDLGDITKKVSPQSLAGRRLQQFSRRREGRKVNVEETKEETKMNRTPRFPVVSLTVNGESIDRFRSSRTPSPLQKHLESPLQAPHGKITLPKSALLKERTLSPSMLPRSPGLRPFNSESEEDDDYNGGLQDKDAYWLSDRVEGHRVFASPFYDRKVRDGGSNDSPSELNLPPAIDHEHVSSQVTSQATQTKVVREIEV